MDRKSIEDCSVPSLSLASSRARRAIPTKDSQFSFSQSQAHQTKFSKIGQVNRPPIFPKRQESFSRKGSSKDLNINRNVYLNREEPTYELSNKKQEKLLRQPESSRIVERQVERALEIKKVDVEKSLFERRVKKLLDQAQFYEDEMNNYLPEDPEKELFDAILNLEQERKESMKIDFGQAF